MDYAIGDIQGCYRELMLLLEKLHFDDKKDTLWLVGDLINRGPDSLQVLRFLHDLPLSPRITLGNHDLHFLAVFYKAESIKKDDTFESILKSPDCERLCEWLKKQRLCLHDPSLNIMMTHAGLPPCWTPKEALNFSKEIETILQSEDYSLFLRHMYGNTPDKWEPSLEGFDRLRLITNYFTRMRYLTQEGALSLKDKGITKDKHLIPWFDYPRKTPLDIDLIFGHWAALKGKVKTPGLFALDTGCVWGETLTALNLQTKVKTQVRAL